MSDTQQKPTTNQPRGWRKSTYSDHGSACVEVNTDADPVLVRDTKYTGPADRRPVIAVPASIWPIFLATVLGEYKGEPDTCMPDIEHNERTGETSLTDAAGTMLSFTRDEWDAFVGAVEDREFSLRTLTSA